MWVTKVKKKTQAKLRSGHDSTNFLVSVVRGVLTQEQGGGGVPAPSLASILTWMTVRAVGALPAQGQASSVPRLSSSSNRY